MKTLALSLLTLLTLTAMGAAESPYEPLVVVDPRKPVVRSAEALALAADVNRLRAQAGLPRVALDDVLSRAALAHARDMAQRRFFGHETPEGTSLPDRLGAVGFHWRLAAENIALDEDERHASAALAKSAPHRANILNPRVRKIGVAALSVGVDAALYVEDFAL
jgi:uncharacterized protein YkwD